MQTTLTELPDSSKLWVFSANRPFSGQLKDEVEHEMSAFVQSWQSHGARVNGAYEIRYNQFILVAADESELPSGCSIDSLFKTIKNLENKHEISLLDRGLISFLIDNKVVQCSFKDLKTELNKFKSIKGTIFFNNLVENLSQLENDWLVTPENSWIKTYL